MSLEAELLEKFVAVDTNSMDKKNYPAFAKLLQHEARKLGLKPKRLDAVDDEGRLCPNFLIELRPKPKAMETILLLAHFDVIPAGEGWKTNPFRLIRHGKKLYGRGSGDDKGAVAAALAAMHELKGKKLRRNVMLLITCDEELGGEYGAGLICRKHASKINADFCLVLDGDFKDVAIGCSGVLGAKILLKGKQGHAAEPYKTMNVIHEAIPFLKELLEFRKVRERRVSRIDAPREAPRKKVWGRFSITVLKAGFKSNVIPASLEIGADIRALPEENHLRVAREFKKFAMAKMKKFGLKGKVSVSGTGGYLISPKNKYVTEVKAAIKRIAGKSLKASATLGGIDGRYIAKLGIPAIAVGPGGKGAHSSKEYITERELLMTKGLIKVLSESGSPAD